jgi:hypothetical protein
MKIIKKITTTLVLLLITLVSTQAQQENLALTFADPYITWDGVNEYYEVDVMATRTATSPDFKLGDGQFYIDYSPAAFGNNIDDLTVDFEYPVGSILAEENLFPIYSHPIINTYANGTVAIAWGQGLAAGAYADDNITVIPAVLGHLKILFTNVNELPNLCFNVAGPGFDDQFSTACGPFTPGAAFADCSGANASTQIQDYDGSDCSGSVIIINTCTSTTSWTTIGGWAPFDPPTSTMNARILDNYNTSIHGNIDACSITVESGATLTIGALEFARVQTDITVDAGGEIAVSHQGSIVQVNDISSVNNAGTIRVFVDTPALDAGDFMMLGSPMSQEAREDVWSAAFNVQAFDPALFEPFVPIEVGATYNFQSADFDAWSPKTGVLNAGEGYLVFPQAGYTAPGGQFYYVYEEGTLNNGVYARTLTYDGTPEGSPNMLSNPYASAIDANVFMAANAEIDAVYFWEHGATSSPLTEGPGDRNYSMRDVSAYNGMGGVQAASGAGTTPNGVISTAQGFGVFASAAGTATFNNSMRLTSGNTTIRTSEVQKDRLWLRVQDLSYGEASNALVGFTSTATEGVDAKYDSQVIENAVSLYSYIDEDYSTAYTIQGREEFSIGATVQLGFSTVIEEELDYSISLSDFDGAAWEQAYVYLVDNETGVVTNLNIEDYRFTATEGTYENRFLLRFQHRVLGTGASALSNVSIYPNPTSRFLNISSPDSMIKSVSIVDLRGRTVMDLNDIVDTNTSIDVSLLRSAVYFAKIQTELGAAEIKFIRE